MSDKRNKTHGQSDKEITSPTEPKAPLDETVRSEIDLAIDREKAMNELDTQWKKERDALAHKPTHEMTFEIGGVSTRSIHAEYTQRRMQHNLKQDAIERDFAKNRNALRDNGTTISNEFDKSRIAQNKTDTHDISHRFNDTQGRGRSR